MDPVWEREAPIGRNLFVENHQQDLAGSIRPAVDMHANRQIEDRSSFGLSQIRNPHDLQTGVPNPAPLVRAKLLRFDTDLLQDLQQLLQIAIEK